MSRKSQRIICVEFVHGTAKGKMPPYQIIFYVAVLFCVLKTRGIFGLNALLSQSCRLRLVLI